MKQIFNTHNQTLNEVQKVIREALGHKKTKIRLFGSWAHGTMTDVSDIDLALDASTLPPGTLAILRERFEESHIPQRVEVIDLADTDQQFKARIIKEGVILWNG